MAIGNIGALLSQLSSKGGFGLFPQTGNLFNDIQNNLMVQSVWHGDPNDGIVTKGELGTFIDYLNSKPIKSSADQVELKDALNLQKNFDNITAYGASSDYTGDHSKLGSDRISSDEYDAYKKSHLFSFLDVFDLASKFGITT